MTGERDVTGRARHGSFAAAWPLALGFGGVLVLAAGVLGWSLFAEISGAVIAPGRLAVETRNQAVEHIDGGTVREILVREGDRVAQGQALLRFADSELRSEQAMLRARLAALAARRNLLEAEFRGAADIAWDEALAARAASDAAVQKILDDERRLFRARARGRAGEAAQLRERIGQTREEIAGFAAEAAALDQQSRLIDRELAAQRGLFEKGLTRLSRLLALERAAKNLEGQSGATTARIARARGRIAELEVQLLQIDSRRIEEAARRIREAGAEETQAKERLAALDERLGRLEVRAPVAGEVFGISVFAAGEVVRPGEPILKIVPSDAPLVAVARLQPIDVDQVYPGQRALLRFPAFPARTTPEFSGHVIRLSADAMRDDRTGHAWYQVELAVDRPVADGARRGFGGLPVTPGMPVEAHIRTGTRSVISYLVKPVTDFFHRSMREE